MYSSSGSRYPADASDGIIFESIWMKSNCGERDNASAIARCGASKIEMSCTAPMPIPVSFVNSAMTGFIGTRYGDQIIPLTSAFPAAFAAAMVCSSIVAAWAKGVVPGTKFATVSPTLPCRNVRREKPDLDITSSSPVLVSCIYLWSDAAERAPPHESIELRLHAAENSKLGQWKCFRRLHGPGNTQTFALTCARGKNQEASGNSDSPLAGGLRPLRAKSTNTSR